MVTLWVLWALGTLGLFAALEWRALQDRVPDTTLSAVWWRLRRQRWVSVPVGAVVGWLLWHLGSPWDVSTGGWDDLVAIAVGAVVGAVAPYGDRGGM